VWDRFHLGAPDARPAAPVAPALNRFAEVMFTLGALAGPTWLLLPFSADWRWLTQRADSPWYPTLRLFSQPAPGDWDGVLAAVTRALDA
jgi:hypothetical protein